MTILFFSEISWRGLFQRPQHLARAMARHWDVIWVEPATILEKTFLRQEEIEPGISVISVPSIPFNARNKTIRALARGLASVPLVGDVIAAGQFAVLKNALTKTDTQLGMVVHNVQSISLAPLLKPRFVIYDYIDNIFGFTQLPSSVEKQWKRCVCKADIVTVTSPVLEQQLRPLRSGPIQYIGNGCEFGFFSENTTLMRPADLPSGKPIVGYIGAVYPWLDFELLRAGAAAMPDIDFVLVGRTHPDIHPMLNRLRLLPNIHILGFKPYTQVPAYLKFMDVGIIPFVYNELTAAVNPVKVYEYSAAGKPTVATMFSEDIRHCGDVITLVNSHEEFIEAIRKSMQRTNDVIFREQLRRFAQENDWSVKTAEFIRVVQQLIH